METASSTDRVHQCSKCPGNTEYYCVSCPCNMCAQCKANHVTDLKTIDHNVLSYRDKIDYITTQVIYVRHPSKVYKKYCEPCELPVQNPISLSNKTKRQQHRGTIHTIRSETLYYRAVLLTGIKADVKTCQAKLSSYQSKILRKAQKLKNLIDYVLYDLLNNVFCEFDFNHRCLKQSLEMIRHIDSLQRYEQRYVQPAFTFSALEFLSSIKRALPQSHLKLHTSQLSMTESLNKEDVMESLSAIQITERGNRCVGNQCLLKLMSGAEFHQSLTVTGVNRCLHIFRVTSDRVWVSDGENIILTNTTGVPLHRVKNPCIGLHGFGLHTVNSESELIYIDRNNNIKKLSKDMKTTTTFLRRINSTWKPKCVFWSPSTGDLLVGMYREPRSYSDDTDKEFTMTGRGRVTRYNQNGQLTKIIPHINTERELYRLPQYITENNNGDVVVSECVNSSNSGAVVVTERGGRHRFSYTGRTSRSRLLPRGICTDTLSHILVCEYLTDTVHILDKDGRFLSHLLLKSQEIGGPWILSYDVDTHRLWVGSGDKNTVVIYRYITRHDALTEEHSPS